MVILDFRYSQNIIWYCVDHIELTRTAQSLKVCIGLKDIWKTENKRSL